MGKNFYPLNHGHAETLRRNTGNPWIWFRSRFMYFVWSASVSTWDTICFLSQVDLHVQVVQVLVLELPELDDLSLSTLAFTVCISLSSVHVLINQSQVGMSSLNTFLIVISSNSKYSLKRSHSFLITFYVQIKIWECRPHRQVKKKPQEWLWTYKTWQELSEIGRHKAWSFSQTSPVQTCSECCSVCTPFLHLFLFLLMNLGCLWSLWSEHVAILTSDAGLVSCWIGFHIDPWLPSIFSALNTCEVFRTQSSPWSFSELGKNSKVK